MVIQVKLTINTKMKFRLEGAKNISINGNTVKFKILLQNRVKKKDRKDFFEDEKKKLRLICDIFSCVFPKEENKKMGTKYFKRYNGREELKEKKDAYL